MRRLTSSVFLLGAFCAGGITTVLAQASTEWIWGYSPVVNEDRPGLLPHFSFLKSRKCPNCQHDLPGLCVISGGINNGSRYQFAVTVLDYASEPRWTTASGHRVPDPIWVFNDVTPFSTTFDIDRWPTNWTLEHWLDEQRATFGRK